jgi:hypothetical protein
MEAKFLPLRFPGISLPQRQNYDFRNKLCDLAHIFAATETISLPFVATFWLVMTGFGELLE